MLKTGHIPIRLLAETLAIVALAEALVMAALQWLMPQLNGSAAGLANASALVLLAAPLLYWRGMAAVRLAQAPRAAAPLAGAARDGRDRQARRRSRAIGMTAVAQASGLLLTTLAVLYVKSQIDEDSHQRFDRHVERLEAEILRRFQQPVYGLKGARGTYAAAGALSRAQFAAYVASRDLAVEFPGARGFGFMQRVQRKDLERFVDDERNNGMPDFKVRTSGTASDLYVVKYIEPLSSNFGAWGFDAGSDVVRREAIERAVNTGEPALTGRVTLNGSGKPTPGFLFLVPVYRPGVSLADEEQRRDALLGLVFAPLTAVDLLSGAAQAAEGALDFELYDGLDTEDSQRVFDVAMPLPAGQRWQPSHVDGQRQFSSMRTLAVGGRRLGLHVSSSAGFEASIERMPLVHVAVGGSLLSLLMALTVWSLASGRIRAQTMADRMTADLERLAQVVRHTSNAVTITDRDLRIVWINEGFTRISGYDIDAARGKTPGELLGSGKADPEVLARLATAAAEARPCRVEILNRRRDGGEYWLDTEIQPLFDSQGQLTGFMEIGSDITDKRRAAEQLIAATQDIQDKEHLMRLVTDNMPGRIAYWDSEHRLRFANRSFLAHYGGSLEERLGQPSTVVLGADRVRQNQAMLARVMSGEAQSFERERSTPDGEVRHELTHMIPDSRDNGVQGFFALTMDISFLKRAEAELRETNLALTAARDRAELASVAKSQFLANMSHEIRTPMNAILGMLKLLQRTPLSVRQMDYAGKTERAAHALLGLLNDILDFSKVEAGKMTLDPRPFRLDRLLRDLSVIVSSTLGSKPVEVLFDVDPETPPALIGDDMRLQQVLVNLAGNAIKFTQAGEVVLKVQLLERDASSCRLRFTVSDTGIGIALEQQQHIFSGFSQAEASTTRRFGGTGLGLSICQRLVALMGGQISVHSVPGQGSSFSFELQMPLGAELMEGGEQVLPKSIALRALIVDDNPTARDVLATMAHSLGWSVDLADGGMQALDLMTQATESGSPYQAVFVDWQMPGLDGWQTSRRIREAHIAEPTPLVLMVTAHGREKLAQRAADEQALLDGFLVKPVTASMLLEAVCDARTVDGHAAAQPLEQTDQPRLVGVRLLVVEDNANNQQVARELLEAEGAEVTLAADGEQGVAAVMRGLDSATVLAAGANADAEPHFDLVLMDVQMPVMDGFTAATQIRQRFGPAVLPIVAMTANAMASDRDASLAAGMNDHVGKPFDLDELVATVQRHLGNTQRPQRAAAFAALRPAAHALPAELMALAQQLDIDLATALRRLGNRSEVWLRSAQSFATELPRHAEQFAAMLARGDKVQAGRLMHTIKGLGATLGANILAERAAEAEKALEREDFDPAAMQSLIARTATAFATLAQHLRSLQPAAAKPPRDGQALRQQLEPLAALLRDTDMAATDLFAELQQAHEPAWQQELQPLAEAMAALDFGAALLACEKLVRVLDDAATPSAADA